MSPVHQLTSQALEVLLDIGDVARERVELVHVRVVLRLVVAVVDDLTLAGQASGQLTATRRSSAPFSPSSPRIMSQIAKMWSRTELM